MRVVRVSGTIRKAEEEAIRRARADMLRAKRGAGDGNGGGGGGGLVGLEAVLAVDDGMEDTGLVDEGVGEDNDEESSDG